MPPSKYQELEWRELTGPEKDEVAREASRYCPELPIVPVIIEEATGLQPFYTEDYRLMRLSSGLQDRKEVWGFYAIGDFHPLDGSGRAFEELNEIGPLNLNLRTVLDYTLLRLRFELPHQLFKLEELFEFRRAEIVTPSKKLPGDLPTEEVNGLLVEPEVVMAPEWELIDEEAPSNIQSGLVFRVVASVVVYHDSAQWEVIKIFAQIDPDGTLTIKPLDATPRSGPVPLNKQRPLPPLILSTQYRRTAMPIREWRLLNATEADPLLNDLRTMNDEMALEFHEIDLKNASALAKKIKGGKDSVSEYLLSRFKVETLNEMREHSDLPLAKTKTILLAELNRSLVDPLLYDKDRFANVTFSKKTQRLLKDELTENECIRLNRSLLEDLYCNELVRKSLVLRQAKLPFYPNCELLEIFVSRDRQYRRSYAMVQTEGAKVHPLTGTSNVIHALNKAPGQLVLTETTVNDYLRFFCWATHGEEGPFYIPLASREIPLLTAPSRSQREELRKINFGVNPVSDTEKTEHNFKTLETDILRKCYVAYASVLFDTWFAIERNGMVKMLKDEPQVLDLVLHRDHYGDQKDDLIELKVEEEPQSESLPTDNLVESESPGDTVASDERDDDVHDSEESVPPTATASEAATNLDTSQEPKAPFEPVLGGMSLVNNVLLYGSLLQLQEEWSRLSSDVVLSSTMPPTGGPRLRKILDEVSNELAEQNEALQFLKAQFAQTSPPLDKGPTILLQALKNLISEIRPEEKVTEQAFLQLLGEAGSATLLSIDDDIVLNTTFISAGAKRDAATKSGTQVEVNISSCWFGGRVKLTDLEDGPAFVFRRCVFENGVFAKDAKIGKALRFFECVFGSDDESFNAIDMENARIRGNLLLQTCSLQGSIYAPRLRSENHVQLWQCGISSSLDDISKPKTVNEMLEGKWPDPERHFERMRLPRLQAITLQGARIEGNLEIRAQWFSKEAPASIIDGSIICDDIFIGLNLDMFGTSCQKDVSFVKAEVLKSVDFRMLRTLDGALHLYGSRIGGGFALAQAYINGPVSLYQARIAGNLGLLGLKTTGNLDLGFAEIGAFIAAYHWNADAESQCLMVGGDFTLSGTKAKAIELRGAEISGKIQIITGTFGRLIMALGAVPEPTEATDGVKNEVRFAPKPCRASVVIITSVVVEESLDLSGLVVEPPQDDRKASRLKMDNFGIAVLVNNSQIGRDLSFFNERVRSSLERRWKGSSEQRVAWRNIPTAPQVQASAWGNVVLEANRISSGLDLRNMNVRGNIALNDTVVRFDVNMDGGDPDFDGFKTRCQNLHAQKIDCSGDIKLSGLTLRRDFLARQAQIKGQVVFLPKGRLSKGADVELQNENSKACIGGDLDLSSVKVEGDLDLRNLEVGGDILLNDTSVGGDLNMDRGSFTSHATNCNNLKAEGLRCNGSARLSGLLANGNFLGRDIHVNSDIHFLATFDREKNDGSENVHGERGYARIGGYIDLTAAKTNGLTLSGKNLSTNLQAQDLDARVRLDRSEIGHLEIMKPPVLGRVNLSGISVTHWEFSSSDGKLHDEIADADHYIDLLKEMTPFDRSTWIDVENGLRNKSLTGDANKVYREMRLRVRDEYASQYNNRLKRATWLFWDWLKYASIGYGTMVWIPMIPALILLIFSLIIFSQPTYVRASANMLEVLDPKLTESCGVECTPKQVGYSWDIRDGFGLALRYHVPILTSLTHSSWEASRKQIVYGVPAELYALIVQVYHWIAWPIFLLAAAAQVVRGRQK